MTTPTRTDGYIELRPDKGKVIINKRTGTKHPVVVCLPENTGKYEEVNK